MKLEPIAGPAHPSVNNAKTEITGGHMSARERAIAAFMSSQAAPPQVQNQTKITPEEMAVVRQPEPKEAQTPGQNYISDEAASAPEPEADQNKASSEPLSSHYAALARREKMLRQRERELKAREAELKNTPSAPQAQTQPQIDTSKYIEKDRLTKDPFTVLTELGLTYDQLTEMALNGPKPEQIALMSEISQLKEEIKALKGETESTKKTFEETQKAQREHALKQIKRDVLDLVRDTQDFELIKATRSYGDVVELIEQTFDQEGYMLSVEQAAREVEDYLTEEAYKLAQSKKIQQRLTPRQEAQASIAPKQTEAMQQQPPLKTLTNAVSSGPKLSARERAMLAFEGKLQR